MKWSKQPPTEPGWYWIKWKNGGRHVIRVFHGRFAGSGTKELRMIEKFAGPIPEPTESDDG